MNVFFREEAVDDVDGTFVWVARNDDLSAA